MSKAFKEFEKQRKEQIRAEAKLEHGIVQSKYKRKKCSSCFYKNRNKICGKHYVLTKDDEICPKYLRYSPTVYGGGRVSPR